jgi:hypothetical protein
MIVTYTVELETKPTFTARKKVKHIRAAHKFIERMRGYYIYSSFRIYNDDFSEVKEEQK